jgi:hypothetical protein
MSLRSKRRNYRCCSEFFFPDYRNQRHRCYCGKPICRHASKLASQRRWLGEPANRDYFRGRENARRAREWRSAHRCFQARDFPIKSPKEGPMDRQRLAYKKLLQLRTQKL